MVLLIDNYDSFTYMLRDYVLQCGEECLVIRNDEMDMDKISRLQVGSIIISPGPRSPAEAGVTMDVIKHFKNNTPILGICLGHQAIGQVYGVRLVSSPKPMHGKTSLITHSEHPIFRNIPEQIDVMRYHSLILERWEANELKVIAETSEGEIMAIAHPVQKIAGLQFHPESILSPYGLQMIRNWFEFIHHND